ncbi:MAG: HAD-IC family P-type ATPase [Clostridia bacterium]|nr:HAD-IC family P-type ATPase [Clostridia bacterium]
MENFEFETNPKTGLTDEQVLQKIKLGKVNKIKTKTSKTYAQIFFGNIFTWFNVICFLIAGILIAVGSFENVLFLVIFLSNLLIGIVQEVRAKITVDKISVFVNANVTVLRNGKKTEVELSDVVEGDIIYFDAGQQICCDCLLIDGKIETNESLLTGESKPVKKQQNSSLLGGSFVVSGSCTAVATKVGMESYSSTLIKKAREVKANKSEILKTLNLVIKTIGFLIVPLGLLTFLDLKHVESVETALIKTSGSVIGMMPVGMFLLTSVSLVVGVLKLAKNKTLVQDLYSIESLARAQVLCLDKTGTITDGTMSVVDVVKLSDDFDINTIMKNYLKASQSNNLTQRALRKHFSFDGDYKAVSCIQFSSERKFSAVTFENHGTFMLGAPEFVTKNLTQETKQVIKDFSAKGLRVVLLCHNKNAIKNDELDNNSTPIAVITLRDNIRPDAKDTIAWFNKNDVDIKIISGDNVDTVSTIAKSVGVKGADKCISLYGLSDEEVVDCATKYNVFGRVSPEQKYLIVKTLRGEGLKVAMTGDGVNDILALKESDCSIAMASGSEATRSASNLVMLNDNFSAMPQIVAEGRRVINNISKASSLFLTKTFFTMFLTIFVLVSPTSNFPLQPNQILLWETLFIGIPAFMLALQANNERVSGSFLGSLTSKALPGAVVLFLSSMACYIYCSVIKNFDLIPTLISYTVTFGAFFILLNLCLPLDKFRSIVCFGLLVLCIISFFIIPNGFFDYVALTSKEFIFLVVAWFFIYLLYMLLKYLLEKVFSFKAKQQ